ncbi:MAG: LysR family transcriptional regulator, partial [Myxococcota bacterium]
MMNWDHVRCFLALIRYGSASEAARHLEVNHTTITRRLRSLEKTLGVTLARHDSDEGWVLTDAGAEVFVVAEQIGESFAELERWVEDRNKQLAGSVRLALPRPMLHLLMPVLAHIADRHPDMAIELHERPLFEGTLPDNVDMALCVTSSPDLDLIGRRIATLRCGIYTAADAKTLGPGDRSLKRLKWVGVHPNSPGASIQRAIGRWEAPG